MLTCGILSTKAAYVSYPSQPGRVSVQITENLMFLLAAETKICSSTLE